MTGWILIDHREPLEREPDEYSAFAYYPKEAVESEGQLRAALARFRQREPALLVLVSPSKESLEIGLGPELSGLRWKKPPTRWNYKRAVNPRPVTGEGIEIADGGGGAGFRSEDLFPTEEVIEAVAQFYREGRLPDSLEWEDL